MSDARGLLDRISAFRQRLEGTSAGSSATIVSEPAAVAVVEEPEAFRHSLRQMTGATTVGPMPPQLTARAHRLLQSAKELLDRQRKFSTDPVFAGLAAAAQSEPDPLVAYHRDTVSVMDSAVRMAQVFPESPSVQLKLCDGLDGVLEIVKERLTVQERALGRRKTDLNRIDRLAALYSAMAQLRMSNMNPVVALAEELLEDARQTRPMRFLHAPITSTQAYPGADSFAPPARYLAAHAINVAQVVARIVPNDYEWAGRPLLPVFAALLMECGMMKVPVDVLMKTGPLTTAERRMIESHPQIGAQLIVRYVPDASPLAEAIASHHERADGTGYPVGLKGSTIPSLGRMLAAADVYVALCSPRPHRDPRDSRTALTDVLLLAEQGILDRDFAEYLVHLSFYPVGSVVELTDGRVGVVAANHPNRMDPRSPGRPVIALLTETDGTLLSRPEHLDLSASPGGGILRTLPIDRRRELLGHRYPDLC